MPPGQLRKCSVTNMQDVVFCNMHFPFAIMSGDSSDLLDGDRHDAGTAAFKSFYCKTSLTPLSPISYMHCLPMEDMNLVVYTGILLNIHIFCTI